MIFVHKESDDNGSQNVRDAELMGGRLCLCLHLNSDESDVPVIHSIPKHGAKRP